MADSLPVMVASQKLSKIYYFILHVPTNLKLQTRALLPYVFIKTVDTNSDNN